MNHKSNANASKFLQVDIDAAEAFLERLDPATKEFTFQTFDDNEDRKDGSLVRQPSGHMRDIFIPLGGLNSRGAGIFVCVNRTDLEGRKTENIVATRAVWADLDKGWPATGFPLPPSLVVETSPGKSQVYWLCEGLTLDEQAGVLKRIVDNYGADGGAGGSTRVLRLPGFWHQKGEPFMVRIKEDTGKRYTREEILAAFPPLPVSRKEKAADTKTPIGELDTPAALGRAWRIIAEHPGVAEPGRDNEAIRVGFQLKDEGISEPECLTIMRRFGAEKCNPPLGDADIERITSSAYRNAQQPPGSANIDNEFENVAEDPAVKAAAEWWTRRHETRGKVDPTGLVTRRASEIEPERITWLWPGRIPMGKCTTIAGEGGKGKTTILLYIVAVVTTEGPWPAGEGRSERGSVLYFSTEDDAADTIVPRLMAAGADLTRVHIVSAVRRLDSKGNRAFNLAEDLVQLEAEIKRIADVRLVIFDPISAYFGRTDTYRNSEVRAVLGPLAEMAARHRISVIGNSHFTKSGTGNANMRVLDSVAITAQSRAVHVVTDDIEEQYVGAGEKAAVNKGRLFLPSKANLGPEVNGLRFHIEEVVVDAAKDIKATRVVWEDGAVKITADEAVAAAGKKDKGPSAVDDAVKFLKSFLANGPKPHDEVFDHAVNSGMHKERTLDRAKSKLGVVSFQSAGVWLWALPNDLSLEFEPIDKNKE